MSPNKNSETDYAACAPNRVYFQTKFNFVHAVLSLFQSFSDVSDQVSESKFRANFRVGRPLLSELRISVFRSFALVVSVLVSEITGRTFCVDFRCCI